MQYLNPVTLHFAREKAHLEKPYHKFHNEDSFALVFLCAVIALICFLLYIILDLSYPTFRTLLIARLVTAGAIGLAVVGLGSMPRFRQFANYFSTALLFVTIFVSCYTLILRDDIDFSPLYMTLLWANMHFPAYFLAERAISGLCTIIIYTAVWIAVLHSPVLELLNTQTLTYVTFYIGAVMSVYGREVASRNIYLQIHDLIPIVQQASSAPSSPSLSRASSPPSSPSSVPVSLNLTSSDYPLLPPPTSDISDMPSLPSPPSPTLSTSSSFSPSLSPSSSEILSPSSDQFLSPSPSSAAIIPERQRDWFDDFMDQMRRAAADCFPAKAAIKELQYHKEVFKYVRMHSYRFTRWFCDPVREARYCAWQLSVTETSVRRFFVLNIASATLLVLHDISFDLNTMQLGIILALRFGLIIPSLILCFIFGSLFKPTLKWRVQMTTVLLIICSATSFAMGILIWHSVRDKDGAVAKGAYELYTGVFTSYIIYGFCGMGLRWVPSVVSGVGLIVISIVIGAFLGFSLSFSSIFAAVVGFTIAFSEAITMRTAFMLSHYRDEIITHLQGKTMAHLASLPASPSAVSVSLGDDDL